MGRRLIAKIVLITALFALPAIAFAGDGAAVAPAAPAAAGGDTTTTGGNDGNGAALQGGAQANPGKHSVRNSLQEALKECEGLTGSASAKCQERALNAHPGQEY